MLAPYAVKKTTGRQYPELEDKFRTAFAHDRDRIIHCKAFRRLSGKTQVFVAGFGDHYRDRLSHTLEMAQVARDLARRLHANEDLAEAIALAHDIGHTPFAHAGEEALSRIMKTFGSHFEHNEQSKRIVELLEDMYPNFPGLNLTNEVREGLAKHQTFYDQRGKKICGKTLEAQIADLADEIAYHHHDLDDGFRAKIFTLEDLEKLSLWKKAEKIIIQKYGKNTPRKYLRYRIMSQLMALMVEDVVLETLKQIKKRKVKNAEDIIKAPMNICGFSKPFGREIHAVRLFLSKKMYADPKVTKHSRHGQKIITMIFWKFYKNPGLLPVKIRAKIDVLGPKEEIVKDYVAGMTDEFATNLYKKLL